jgi:hypothetical protein
MRVWSERAVRALRAHMVELVAIAVLFLLGLAAAGD